MPAPLARGRRRCRRNLLFRRRQAVLLLPDRLLLRLILFLILLLLLLLLLLFLLLLHLLLLLLLLLFLFLFLFLLFLLPLLLLLLLFLFLLLFLLFLLRLLLLLLLLLMLLLMLMSRLDRTFGDRRERRDPRELRGEPDDGHPAAHAAAAARVSFSRRRDVDRDVRGVDLFTGCLNLC